MRTAKFQPIKPDKSEIRPMDSRRRRQRRCNRPLQWEAMGPFVLFEMIGQVRP